MAVCITCGTENPDHHRFCSRCGARITAERPPAEPPKTPASPELAERLLDHAFQYSDEGRLEDAIRAAEQAVAANPNSTSAHSLLGILYERAGQRQRAISEYEHALALSPRSTADREALRQLISAPSAKGRPAAVRAVVFATFILACGLLVAGIGLVLRPGTGGQPMMAGTEPGKIAPALGGFPVPPGVVPSSATLPQKPPSAPAARSEPARAMPVPEAVPVVPQPRVWPATQRTTQRAVPTVRVQPFAPPPAKAYPIPEPVPDRPMRVPPPMTLRTRPATITGPPPSPVVPSQEIARAYYFQRDYPKAIESYEQLLADKPDARAHVREELGWCYYQMNRTGDSVAQYRSALSAYEKERARPETREEAEHGMRTCQAALRALGGR